MAIVVAYVVLSKKLKASDTMQIKQLREGTQEKSFSFEILYQKLYNIYIRNPFTKRYLFKVRRRLEIINIDDEYLTRKQTSAIVTKALMMIIPITLVIILITKSNTLLMSILLLFELFMIDTLVDGMVDKIDNKLLVQQIDFFAEIRHAYHEFNMVEEAIYQVAQGDSAPEMSRQAEKIYEILISNDPESELEKYYDVAPNSYLKEFAGISYLTKEFGDRTVDKTSLYLKNLNNISQEMQLEILKRDKLDYVFQSLSVISILPLLCLEPIKSWAVSEFNFTKSFYYGKNGMIVQLLLVIITFICYILTRKLKGTNIFRTVFFMPNLIGGIVLGYIWLIIINGVLNYFGVNLTMDPKYGFWGLVILLNWQQIGYMMIIYIAGIQNIPGELIESAKIDGASKWMTLKKVIIPLVMPSITICLFLTMSNAFKLFDQNLALTDGAPGNKTAMLALDIYKTFYGRVGWEGVGQAKAVIFFLIVAAIMLLQLNMTRKKEVEN